MLEETSKVFHIGLLILVCYQISCLFGKMQKSDMFMLMKLERHYCELQKIFMVRFLYIILWSLWSAFNIESQL